MPDPEAICVNAVSFSWTYDIHVFYYLPPFSMLERVLQKIKQDNTDVVVITPMCPIYPRFP